MKHHPFLPKRLLSILIAGILLWNLSLPVGAASLSGSLLSVQTFLKKQITEPEVSSIGGDWAVLFLERSNAEVSAAWEESYFKKVDAKAKENQGILHSRKYTENARVVLALSACGRDARKMSGGDLVKPLWDTSSVIKQGINGPVWALIALNSRHYPQPENKKDLRQVYIDEILKAQLSDGGWAYSGTKSDPDVTAMALMALREDQKQSAVSKAVTQGVECLSKLQKPSGGYASGGTENCESASQVLIALGSLGISYKDKRFVKGGKNLVDVIGSYQKTDGSFSHLPNGSSNGMATEQAALALLQASLGSGFIYSFPEVCFEDIENCPYRKAILSLREKKIFNGVTETRFQPENSLTRAQFCVSLNRALGGEMGSTMVFQDLPKDYWAKGHIASIYEKGIINGTTLTTFSPFGSVTYRQAELMLSRALKYLGGNSAGLQKVQMLTQGRQGNITRGEAAQLISLVLPE